MKPMLKITAVLRVLVTLILLMAAIEKLRDPAAFGQAIERYRLLRELPSAVLALYLPWLELILALAWWLPWTRRQTGAVICGLMAVFTAVVASVLVRGLDIRCGCFGESLDFSPPLALARNILLLAAAGWIWLADLARWSRAQKRLRSRPDSEHH